MGYLSEGIPQIYFLGPGDTSFILPGVALVGKMAEREGFEPPIPVKVYTLSRRAPSATRPSLRAHRFRFILSGQLLASNFRAHLTKLSGAQPPVQTSDGL